MPVVVMLHGGGGTGRGAAIETGWNAKADRTGFLVVFPEAQARDPTKPGNFATNPQLWNDGSGRFYPGQKTPDDVAFLNAVLDEVFAQFVADRTRVFVTGFSNGASMAFRYGAAASTRVAAIAPVAGTCWFDPAELARPVAMCYITGTADPVNLIEGGVAKFAVGGSEKVRSLPKPPVRDSILKWAQAIGCPAAPASISETDGVRTEIYGPGGDGAEVVYVTVEDLGHVWAGGRTLLPESLVGKGSDKLKATDLLWDFFQRHPIPSRSVES